MNTYDLRQLRGAYGAGRAAATKETEDNATLEGKYFHTKYPPGTISSHSNEDISGQIKEQGQVLSVQRDGYYLVQYFSWLDGRETNQALVHFSHMVEWAFYASADEWRYAYERQEGLPCGASHWK